jgi:hypothetical protein
MTVRGVGVRELARQVPCNPGHISQLRNGQKRPSAQTARRLDEVLCADGRLAAAAPARRPGHTDADTTGAGSGEVADDAVELIELTRRVERSDVGPGTLDALHVATDRLCRDYSTVPVRVLRDRARKYLRCTLGLLDRRKTLRQHRDLLVNAGWLAALLACVCYDAGQPLSAESARRMTRQLGEQAGHGELVGWAFEIAAWFALVEGRFADTVALCEAGLAHAGTCNAGVQITVQAGRGYARMGDSRAVEMLAAGKAMLHRIPEPSHPEHHFVFDRGKYEFYVATVLTWYGGDDAAAEEHARWVVTQCRRDGSVRWPMRLANSQIDLALLASRRHDLDEAVTLGESALALERRSAQLLPRAVELKQDLTTRYPGERLVSEFGEVLHEQLRALPSDEPRSLKDALPRRNSGEASS